MTEFWTAMVRCKFFLSWWNKKPKKKNRRKTQFWNFEQEALIKFCIHAWKFRTTNGKVLFGWKSRMFNWDVFTCGGLVPTFCGFNWLYCNAMHGIRRLVIGPWHLGTNFHQWKDQSSNPHWGQACGTETTKVGQELLKTSNTVTLFPDMFSLTSPLGSLC